MEKNSEFYRLEIIKSKRKYFKIENIISGMKRIDYCKSEESFYWAPYKELDIKLNDKMGEEWPDMLADNIYENNFILSERTFDILEEIGISNCRGFTVNIVNSNPYDLILSETPNYYLVNGNALIGAEIDFIKSGFPNYYYCKECGTLRISMNDVINNIEKGIELPTVFKEDSWNGKMLFAVTNGIVHGYSYYCTKEFFDIVKRNKLSNFRFSTMDGNKSFSFL